MSEKQSETEAEMDIAILRCRTCLQELDANSDLVDMFQCWVPPWKGMKSTIAEDLAKLANIEIKYTDKYPKVICEPCCPKLQNACDFVYSVRMNDSVLRQRKMDNNEICPKPIEKDKNINKTVNSNVMDIEIKQELPDVECADSDTMEICRNNELATVEIKIEPEDFIQENQYIEDNHIGVVEMSKMDGQSNLQKKETTNIKQRSRIMSGKEGETQTETNNGLLRCRTCLQELDANTDLVDMFQCWVTPWKGMASTIAEDLAKLANIEIKYTDKYPKVICETCCLRLQNACDFVYSVRMNDSVLRQIDDGKNKIWPKPIEVDKNINKTVYNNVMDIEIKQELPDVDCTDSDKMEIYRNNELATVEIKIEPEIFIQEDQNIDDNQRPVEMSEMHGQCFLHNAETTNIKQRYAPEDLPVFPKCKHNTKSLKYSTLTMNDLINIHKHFYSSKDKLIQDNFILRNCVTKSVKRHRPTNGTRSSKNMSVTAVLPTTKNGRQ